MSNTDISHEHYFFNHFSNVFCKTLKDAAQNDEYLRTISVFGMHGSQSESGSKDIIPGLVDEFIFHFKEQEWRHGLEEES